MNESNGKIEEKMGQSKNLAKIMKIIVIILKAILIFCSPKIIHQLALVLHSNI
jgi:hypothetical protein